MRRRTGTRALLASLVLAGLVSSPVRGDDVYLTNGRVFEDVVADVGESHVVIRLAFGEMRLPRGAVLRVDVADSAFAEYVRRRDELRAREVPDAGEWLALAQWARARGLEAAFREAARTASRLDPELPGLAPLMRSLDLVFDEPAGQWVSYADHMLARGMIWWDGRWVPREERAAAAAAQAEAARLDDDAETRRLLQDLLALSAVQLAQQVQAAPQVEPPVAYAAPLVAAFPAGFVRVVHHRRPPPVPTATIAPRPPFHVQTPSGPVQHLLFRQPGSLIPGVLPLSGGPPPGSSR